MATRSSNIMSEKDLLALRKKIDDGKSKLAEMKGKQKYLLTELATKWGCKTIEEAEQKAAKYQKELDDISCTLDALLADIADKYSDELE